MSQALLSMMSAGGVSAPTYVDDVFSAYTRSGTGASATITNGIDLSTKGGLVITKARSATTGWRWTDTARGVQTSLDSSSTAANATESTGLTAFNNNGYTVGADTDYNNSTGPVTYVDYSFAKAAKFFDVVTYTGNGSNRTISHNLGQVPGMIIVKRTDTTGSWMVYHRSLANTENLVLNTTAAKTTNATAWNSTTADASVFSLGTHADVNTNGGTYVAYLFAHDTGTDGLIQCGSYTGTGGEQSLLANLGWEPQFIFTKCTTQAGDWVITDVMRGNPAGAQGAGLFPNASSAEGLSGYPYPSATGITSGYQTSQSVINQTYIYLAIRRPNKPPTSGTQVYDSTLGNGSGIKPGWTSSFHVDAALRRNSVSSTADFLMCARLLGQGYCKTTATDAEATAGSNTWDTPNGWGDNIGVTTRSWMFRRAPGVFDVVCFTSAANSSGSFSHSLSVSPEMIITKSRAATSPWYVYHKDVTANYVPSLNTNAVPANGGYPWTLSASSVTIPQILNANQNYVAYLFATKAGISKVFSYTGNGTNQSIECGFAAGARFVLIKRTDLTGDWLVADTTRGIIAGNDPSLALNSTAAEVTTLDWIDPYSGGFNVVQESTNNANVNNATYIGLALS